MKESTEYKGIKRRLKRLQKIHASSRHDWTPMGLVGGDMLLGCECGAFVFVPGNEVNKFGMRLRV